MPAQPALDLTQQSDPAPARAPYQVMPDLTAEEYAALRDSIKADGLLVPIVYDEDGNILDGHHRVKICQELGIPLVLTMHVGHLPDVAAKRAYARALNLNRRQLTREQRRELIAAQLKDTPEKSDRQIGKAMDVDHKTVASVRREQVDVGKIPHVTTRTDTKGRKQPTKKPTKPAAPHDDARVYGKGRSYSPLARDTDHAQVVDVQPVAAKKAMTPAQRAMAAGEIVNAIDVLASAKLSPAQLREYFRKHRDAMHRAEAFVAGLVEAVENRE